MKAKLSREGAISNLRTYFGNTGVDYVSVEDIFRNAGRADKTLEENRRWLYNRLTLIKPYGLYDKVHGIENKVRVTRGLTLTTEGRKALYGDEPIKSVASPYASGQSNREVTITTVRNDIKVLKEKYPEFDIIFDAKLKEEEEAA
jgi:hypothetical protein